MPVPPPKTMGQFRYIMIIGASLIGSSGLFLLSQMLGVEIRLPLTGDPNLLTPPPLLLVVVATFLGAAILVWLHQISSHSLPNRAWLLFPFPALCLFLAVVGYTSWLTPLSVGPDEVAHFQYARYIFTHGALPVTVEEREEAGYKSDQPPLNAWLIALAFWGGSIDGPPYVKLTHSVPRRSLVADGLTDPRGRSFSAINTEDPIAGEYQFWYIGRLWSAVTSLLTLVVIYLFSLKLFSAEADSRLWAFATVASIAFIPTYIFMSGMLTYESLLAFWLSLYLWVALLLYRGRQEWWLYTLSGLLIGLAIVTKYSALIAPLSLLVLLAGLAWMNRWSRQQGVKAAGSAFIGLMAGGGWWFIWVIATQNRIAEQGWIAGILGPILVGDGSDAASGRIISRLAGDSDQSLWLISGEQVWGGYLFITFWDWHGRNAQPMYTVLGIVSCLAIVGLLRYVWRLPICERGWWAFLGIHTALFFVLPFVRLVTANIPSAAGQGHHVLYPALPAFALILVVGLGNWLPRRYAAYGGLGFAVVMLGWQLVLLQTDYNAQPVPVRTVSSSLPEGIIPLSIEDEFSRMMGYQINGLGPDGTCCQPGQTALEIDFFIESKAFSPHHILPRFELINATHGQAQSVWQSKGANGRYPRQAWEPGDIVQSRVWFPLVGVPEGQYRIEMGTPQEKFPVTTLQITEHPFVDGQPETAYQLWQAGQMIASEKVVFRERETLQITTREETSVSLVGPDQTTLSPRAQAGLTHNFVIEPIWPKGSYRLLLETVSGGAELTDPVLTIRGPERTRQIRPNQFEVRANFADYLMLQGYDLPEPSLKAEQPFRVDLTWQALQTVPIDFIMFVRLYDESGQLWWSRDRWPQEYYSPILWASQEVVEDTFAFTLPAEAPAGAFYLNIGFYFVVGDAPVSLPLLDADDQYSELTTVTIGPLRYGD